MNPTTYRSGGFTTPGYGNGKQEKLFPIPLGFVRLALVDRRGDRIGFVMISSNADKLPITNYQLPIPQFAMKTWDKFVIFCGILLLILPVAIAAFSATNLVNKFTCTYQGNQLYGRVKFVESLQDIKVKVVATAPDLRVKLVTNQTNQCGEWQIVDFLPDLKVQVVDTLPDIEIQFVENNPGV